MKVIKNEKTVFCDIDGTLILPNETSHIQTNRGVYVKDPLNKGRTIFMREHGPMVRLLKEEFHRGSHIVVWSRGGYEWAVAVLEALKLTKYVHLAMSKPMVYFDDVPVEEWLPYRVFLDPDMRYKK